MRNLIRNPWVVAGLCLAAAILAGVQYWPRQAEGAAVGDAPASDGSAVPAERPVDAALRSLQVPASSRDPFAARSAVAPKTGPLMTVRLSGIWTQAGKTFVLLGGAILGPGESFGRLRIEAASQDGVWISRGGERSFVALGQSYSWRAPAGEAASL